MHQTTTTGPVHKLRSILAPTEAFCNVYNFETVAFTTTALAKTDMPIPFSRTAVQTAFENIHSIIVKLGRDSLGNIRTFGCLSCTPPQRRTRRRDRLTCAFN
mmetsp:Transcript_15205/g.22453  ORF Transcript_15205/g.22453 Transcript_15205/m.22453 type:complete len:102 (+) Transcript_15205:26-331(+)